MCLIHWIKAILEIFLIFRTITWTVFYTTFWNYKIILKINLITVIWKKWQCISVRKKYIGMLCIQCFCEYHSTISITPRRLFSMMLKTIQSFSLSNPFYGFKKIPNQGLNSIELFNSFSMQAFFSGLNSKRHLNKFWDKNYILLAMPLKLQE